MLEAIYNHALSLGHHAPWVFFVLLILAGLNFPISADIIILCAATLAATIMPEYWLVLYLSVLLGCMISAWGAYFLGRFLGEKLLKIKWFSAMLPEKRLEKVRTFYQKRGLLTLMVGRFIPFGVRNAMFMTTGMAKLSFRSFAIRDSIACFVWCSAIFCLFYKLAEHFEFLKSHLKMFNGIIFATFAVAAMGFLWYKKRKKMHSSKPGV